MPPAPKQNTMSINYGDSSDKVSCKLNPNAKPYSSPTTSQDTNINQLDSLKKKDTKSNVRANLNVEVQCTYAEVMHLLKYIN